VAESVPLRWLSSTFFLRLFAMFSLRSLCFFLCVCPAARLGDGGPVGTVGGAHTHASAAGQLERQARDGSGARRHRDAPLRGRGQLQRRGHGPPPRTHPVRQPRAR
jgi:hypothetical protein